MTIVMTTIFWKKEKLNIKLFIWTVHEKLIHPFKHGVKYVFRITNIVRYFIAKSLKRLLDEIYIQYKLESTRIIYGFESIIRQFDLKTEFLDALSIKIFVKPLNSNNNGCQLDFHSVQTSYLLRNRNPPKKWVRDTSY